jgi:hypothetical protein
VDTLIKWSWVFGLIGVLSALISMVLWVLLGVFWGPPTSFATAAAVFLALYLALDRDRIGDTVTSRSFAVSSGGTLLAVMAAVIGVACYVLAEKYDKTWDWTRPGDFSLSDHTASVAGGLDESVEVLAFYRDGSPEQGRFEDLIRGYREATARISVQWIDPLSEPMKAKQHEVKTDDGTVILRTSDGRERRLAGAFLEEELTSALVLLVARKEHQVCWVVGHGEADPDDELSDDGLGSAVLALEQGNYRVVPRLTATEGLGAGCDAVVLARPEIELFPYEREALAAYLASGGRVLALFEPFLTPELAAEFQRYGVLVGEDVVLDFNPKNRLLGVDEPSIVVLTEENLVPHPITASLGAAVVLGVARSVRADESRAGFTLAEVLRTSDAAWAETEPDGPNVAPDEDIDLIGEVAVMVALTVDDPAAIEVAKPAGGYAEHPQDAVDDAGRGVPADFTPSAGGRMVVIGDADFANNRLVEWGNNRDLFLNSLAWLLEEEDQLGERPEVGDALELSAMGGIAIVLINVFLIPGLAALLGFTTLLRRRFL